MSPSVESKEVNAPGGHGVHSRSKFNLSYTYADTYQFGLIKPCQVSDIVPKDKDYLVHSGHDARSFNLRAPLMQNVNMYKAHVAVPMQAILPNNWNKFFDQPILGEDVPDDCGCGVESFNLKVRSIFLALAAEMSTPLPYTKEFLQAFLRWYQFGSMIYSNGSLLSSLGCHFGTDENCGIWILNPTNPEKVSFDRLCEILLQQFASRLNYFEFHFAGETTVYSVIGGQFSGHSYSMTLKEFLFNYLYDGAIVVDSLTISNACFDDISEDQDYYSTWEISQIPAPLNIARLWAYQLACAHFFTNDKIDYIFSAELFRQLIGNYINLYLNYSTFSLNGMEYQYDYLSALYFNAFSNISNFSSVALWYSHSIDYFLALFSFRHSLKFMDYFTGARTRPLAIGDVYQNVAVSGAQGQFNVIDLASNTWLARFRQFLMRYGAKSRNYIKGVFGITPAYDFHDPMWLGKTTDKIYSVETDNTAEAQLTEAMTTTAQFRSNGDRFAFSFSADRATIIVSLVYFDIDRLYTATIDRQMFAMDRFDYFNPFTQFIGDQPIYAAELNSKGGLNPWAYTNRNQEYKTRFNQASGGFVEFLPGWAFLADKNSPTNLTPRFIRSSPTELDRFYNSLTHFTPAGYFHFIIKNRNTITAVRPMAFNPIVSF